MKKATVILSLVLVLILSIGTVTAFANGGELEQLPYSFDTEALYESDDLYEVYESMFGEFGSELIGITVAIGFCMMLFIPVLVVMIVFIVLNSKTKKKIKEYQKLEASYPVAPVNIPGIFSQTATIQNPQPVNTNTAPMGVNPGSDPNAEPQNNNINEQGGQF